MSDLFWLTGEQMAKLSPFFPKSHGEPRVDDRRVLSGIILFNRNGLRWRDAPMQYSPHETLCSRWSENGIFARMMAGLAAEHGEKASQAYCLARETTQRALPIIEAAISRRRSC